MRIFFLLTIAFSSMGCKPAFAGRPVYSQRGHAYQQNWWMEIVSASERKLPTYDHNGRTYVLGHAGQRYKIRIHNPTRHRVEAVLSVDGLDAMDGRVADYANKRGYIIEPWGTTEVDGFRVSMNNVATFRFSSVANSYAGRKGKARHVGVIGVAVFRERGPRYRRTRPRWQRGDGTGRSRSSERDAELDESLAQGSKRSDQQRNVPGNALGKRAPVESKKPAIGSGAQRERRRARRGLGTEFGERRYSQAHYTHFRRRNRRHPDAILTIRYNNRQGLIAMGVPVHRSGLSHRESHLRHTANPFPQHGFAKPPTGWEF